LFDPDFFQQMVKSVQARGPEGVKKLFPEYLSGFTAIRRTQDPVLFHLFDKKGGFVVSYAEASLNE
jgi:hypothetical protein